jgi:hypothetical protein
VSVRAALLQALLVAAAIALAPSAHAEAFRPADPALRTFEIAIVPPQTIYPLSAPFLLAGTDRARVRGRELERGRDYFLDAVTGEFRLNTTLAQGDTVHLTVRALVAPPPLAYSRRPALAPPPPGGSTAAAAAAGDAIRDSSFVVSPVLRPGAAGTPLAGRAGSELSLTGNKTVAVDFGSSRDVALRQSLDLNVSGRLAPGVDLVGVLSDRNTPLTIEGDTRELRELDRILLEVKSEDAGGALGDYTLREERGTFARFARELTGVEAHGKTGVVSGGGALASTKGRYASLQFQGQEARQGPYFLPDTDGRTGVPLVQNSEEVWLDGERLARGESADYSMDYDRGTITFTSRRLISSASRIAVDYQIAGSGYRRTLGTWSGEAKVAGGAVYGRYFRESDASSRPLSFSLTDQDAQELAFASDSSGFGLVGGIEPGPGDYDAFTDSAGITRFAFAGVDSGDFKVSFASLGAGRGDYAESTIVLGRRIYRFVGAGLGDAVPGRLVPLPNALGVWSAGAALKPAPWLTLEGEGALSSYTGNTFSASDERTQHGEAWRGRVDVGGPVTVGDRPFGRVGAYAALRSFDASYRSPGRLDPAFSEEDWGVDATRPLTAQNKRLTGVTWAPRPSLETRAEYGALDADSGFAADRTVLGARATGPLSFDGRVERVVNERDFAGVAYGGLRRKLLASATWTKTPWIRPTASVDTENRQPPGATQGVPGAGAGAHYRAWSAGAAFPRVGPLELTTGVGLRTDGALGTEEWHPFLEARSLRAAASGRFGASVTAALGAERRVQEPVSDAEPPPGGALPPKTTSDIGYARFRQAIGARGGEHTLSFEWTGEGDEIRTRSVRFVSPGGGAYDSLGNFVGQGNGSYDVVLTATGAFERVVRTSGAYRFDLAPASVLGDSSSLARALDDARATLLLQATLARRGAFTLADLVYTPKRILGREDVATGSYLVRPELLLGQRSRWASVLLRVERRASADRQFEDFELTRDEWLEEARWRAKPDPRWLAEVSLRLDQGTSRQSAPSFSAPDRRLRAQSAVGEATYLPNDDWRLGLIGSLDRVDALDDALEPSRVARFGPHAVWQRGGAYRVEALVRRAAIAGGAIPALVPAGFPAFPDRWDYTLQASVRLRERANLVLSGDGRAPLGRTWIHTGRAELRAYF